MFILNSSDVVYCQVTDRQGRQTENLPGISYRGFLFAKVASYQSHQLVSAITHCQSFLDFDEPVLSIVVKEGRTVSVWSHSEGLIPASKELDSKDWNSSFAAIKEKMSTSTFLNRKKDIKPGALLHFSYTGDTYQVLKLEDNGNIIKAKNLVTGSLQIFSIAEIYGRVTELETA